jgi:hypothetical protein
MLVLGDQCVLRLAIDQAFPQRADQGDEAGGFDDLPAVGFEFCRGLAGHSWIPSFLACVVISSMARMV